MVDSHFVFEPLGRHHDRAAFSCGVEELDRYLQQQARQDAQRNIAAVFILQDTINERIAGYYTLSASSLEPESLPEALTRKLPRYASFPSALIGRLAVDGQYQGQALGELLLFDAFRRVLAQILQIAALAIVVDAKDDRARSFYERYGFQRLSTNPYQLFILMQTVAAAVGDR